MNYKLTKVEQETQIFWDASDNIAHIYSSNPTVIHRLDKLAEAYPYTYKCIWEDSLYKARKYTVDAKHIRFGKPASEKQIAAAKENGKNGRFCS